jgi:hypothetical protein
MYLPGLGQAEFGSLTAPTVIPMKVIFLFFYQSEEDQRDIPKRSCVNQDVFPGVGSGWIWLICFSYTCDEFGFFVLFFFKRDAEHETSQSGHV